MYFISLWEQNLYKIVWLIYEVVIYLIYFRYRIKKKLPHALCGEARRTNAGDKTQFEFRKLRVTFAGQWSTSLYILFIQFIFGCMLF